MCSLTAGHSSRAQKSFAGGFQSADRLLILPGNKPVWTLALGAAALPCWSVVGPASSCCSESRLGGSGGRTGSRHEPAAPAPGGEADFHPRLAARGPGPLAGPLQALLGSANFFLFHEGWLWWNPPPWLSGATGQTPARFCVQSWGWAWEGCVSSHHLPLGAGDPPRSTDSSFLLRTLSEPCVCTRNHARR